MENMNESGRFFLNRSTEIIEKKLEVGLRTH